MALLPKEKLFIEAYFNNAWDARKAGEVIAGGPDRKNYYRKYMANPEVQAEIDLRLREGHLSANQVLRRLSEMANSNLADFIDEDGKVNWPKLREKGYLVKSRKLRTTYGRGGEATTECEITLYDAQAALEKIGKNLGLFKEPSAKEQDNPLGFPGQLQIQLPSNMSVEELRQFIQQMKTPDANTSDTNTEAGT